MNTRRDPDRLIDAFLREGADQMQDQVYDAVRAEIERTRQRAVIGPWRMPTMNKLVPIGLAAAAVVVAVVVASQLLPAAPSGVGGVPSDPPSATSAPSPSVWSGLPEGPYVVTQADDPVQVAIDIASPGWTPVPDLDFVSKDDDGLDPPGSVGAGLLAWGWPAGTRFHVYEDPCRWSTTIPETAATTPAEIAAALAKQALTDPTAPTDVTVGGFAGKAVTLHVPMSYDVPGASREERFGDCDGDLFGFYGVDDEPEPARNAQGAGQIDELWILDVNGSIVILDGTYGPAAPAELVEEMRTLAGSATFE